MSKSADSPMKFDFSPGARNHREKKSFAFLLPHEMYDVDAREERNFPAAILILLPHEILSVHAPMERENGLWPSKIFSLFFFEKIFLFLFF
jgi:hypothetical protein